MPAPIPIHLTATQRKSLQRLQATAPSRRAWARIMAVLLLAAGTPVAQVAALLAVSVRTIPNWKRRWLEGRSLQLHDAPRPGRPPRADARYLALLAEAVERGPPAYGYLFTVWSAARLAAHLARKTKRRLGPDRLRQLLHDLGFVYGRPKPTLKGRQNRRAARATQAQLEALKKGRWPRPPAMNSGLRTRLISICTPT